MTNKMPAEKARSKADVTETAGSPAAGGPRSHYDLSPGLFEMFLDRDYRAYSAGRWDDADDLETAQRFNLTAISNALQLTTESWVLDIGCGWGAFARVCPCRYVGITPSPVQFDYLARLDRFCLPDIHLYSTTWQHFAVRQKFDAVVANEVIEHITSRRDVEPYRRFFEFCAACSTPKAKLYVQTTLQRRKPRTRAEKSALWFILRRVFPNSITADLECIQQASKGLYVPYGNIEFDHLDYIMTLEAWLGNLHDNRYEFTAEFGRDQFLFFDRYFTSCLDLFDAGVIELLRATFSKEA